MVCSSSMDPVSLSVFSSRIEAVCDEMGAVLRRAAFSPNIKDRLDFSCAVFDPHGGLCAQAAHIPVHLGSMAYAMAGLVEGVDWARGDMLIVNDPFLGGTHLPDVTLIAPVFLGDTCIGFVVNRAHHADIGAHSPGSMPLSHRLDEEGLVIPPSLLMRRGTLDMDFLRSITGVTSDSEHAAGDFAAQISANQTGVMRLLSMAADMGAAEYLAGLAALNDYAGRLAGNALSSIPDGVYRFRDVLDDDGMGHEDIPIEVCITARKGMISVDFDGTAAQVRGNVNCPIPVAAASVYYVFRCLMPSHTPACAGSFRPISISAPAGCLLNARRPAAVAAGNVETSSRVVDVVLGALAGAMPDRIPAASQGTMNNLAMGARQAGHSWDYYETMAGGMGGGPKGAGLSAVQSHMTNTLNTPIEVLEMEFPLRIHRYQVRNASGGEGRNAGGNGLVRDFEFLEPAMVTLLSERRRHAPWGLAGGQPGRPGRNLLDGEPLPGKISLRVQPGQRLVLETPGGGGWGTREGAGRDDGNTVRGISGNGDTLR